MKKFFLSMVVCLLVIGGFATYNFTKSKNNEPTLETITTVNELTDGTRVVTSTSVRTFDSVDKLAKGSDIVVEGTVIKKEATSRNLQRNVDDPSLERSDRKTMSQEYTFEVQKWLKGSGPEYISVVYPEYTLWENGVKTEASDYPLTPNKRYVLFLAESKLIKGTYHKMGEPWQFELQDNLAVPKSKCSGILNFFNALNEDELLQQVGYPK